MVILNSLLLRCHEIWHLILIGEYDNQMKGGGGISQMFWLEGIEGSIKLHLTETEH